MAPTPRRARRSDLATSSSTSPPTSCAARAARSDSSGGRWICSSCWSSVEVSSSPETTSSSGCGARTCSSTSRPASIRLIWKVRAALRDSPDAPTFVETVAGKGYRFIAPVEVSSPPSGRVASELPSPRRGCRSHPTRRAPRSVYSSDVDAAAGAAPASGRTRRASSWRPPLSWAWLGGGRPGPRITLAVLPFENLGGDPEREYLADGLAEETIASLGQIDPEHLSVIGRTSMTRTRAPRSRSPRSAGSSRPTISWRARFRRRAVACASPPS